METNPGTISTRLERLATEAEYTIWEPSSILTQAVYGNAHGSEGAVVSKKRQSQHFQRQYNDEHPKRHVFFATKDIVYTYYIVSILPGAEINRASTRYITKAGRHHLDLGRNTRYLTLG